MKFCLLAKHTPLPVYTKLPISFYISFYQSMTHHIEDFSEAPSSPRVVSELYRHFPECPRVDSGKWRYNSETPECLANVSELSQSFPGFPRVSQSITMINPGTIPTGQVYARDVDYEVYLPTYLRCTQVKYRVCQCVVDLPELSTSGVQCVSMCSGLT